MVTPTSKLGQALRRARVRRGTRQEDISACSGISSQYYSLIETGARRPKLDVCLRVCACLGISKKKAISLWLASPPLKKVAA